MENKYRAVKQLLENGRKFNKKASEGCFDEILFVQIKGSFKLLDEGDYREFSYFCTEDGKVNLRGARLFLEEKMTSYKNYDFLPEDQRLKEREYQRERNLWLIKFLNCIIYFLIWARDKLVGL